MNKIFRSIYEIIEPKISGLILVLIFNLTTGLRSERIYWYYILLRRHGYRESKRLNKKVRKEIFPKELLSFVKKPKAKVLELGSGPLSDLAWGVEEGLIEVVAIDVLAKEYNEMLRNRKIDYPIRPTPGTGENLSFEKKSFDIVYSRNALDHMIDPKRCVRNMVKVLKKNGFLYIRGNVKVGSKVHWRGLHQHDLVAARRHLIHYNQERKQTNLTSDLGLNLIYKSKTGDTPGSWFTMVFKKM